MALTTIANLRRKLQWNMRDLDTDPAASTADPEKCTQSSALTAAKKTRSRSSQMALDPYTAGTATQSEDQRDSRIAFSQSLFLH